MARQGYHINRQGEAKPCNATKRPCRFGGKTGQENHYASLIEAENAAEAQIKASIKGNVQKSLTKDASRSQLLKAALDFDQIDLDRLPVATRSDLLTFEAMKRSGSLHFGRIVQGGYNWEKEAYDQYSSFYGMNPVMSKAEKAFLKQAMEDAPVEAVDHGGWWQPKGYPSLRSYVAKGYKVNFIPATSETVYEEEFGSTDGPALKKAFITSKAVMVSPSGQKEVFFVSGEPDIDRHLPLVLKLAEEKRGGPAKKQDQPVADILKKQKQELDEYFEDDESYYYDSDEDY